MIGDSYALIDCKGKGRIEINVEVEGHRGTSKITILDSSDCVEMLKSVATLGKSLGHVENSRKMPVIVERCGVLAIAAKQTRQFTLSQRSLQ